MKKNLHGAFLILLATVVWGSTGVFVKTLQLPATTIVVFRLGVPLICVVAYLLYRKKSFGLGYPLAWKYSFWNSIRMLLYYIGFNLATVANAVIALYTWPLFAAMIDFHRTKEITPINLICTLLGLAGVVVTVSHQSFGTKPLPLIGFFLIVISAIISATQRYRQKDLMRHADNTQMILYQSLVGVIIFSPFLIFNRPAPSVHQVGIAAIFGLLIGILGFYLYFTGLRKVSIAYMSILSYFEVISAIIFAYFILHEVPTFSTLLGGLLIILSIVIISIHNHHREQLSIQKHLGAN